MSEKEITQKLREFLNSRKSHLNEECDVVYFLVEIRKVLEHQKNKNQYRFLSFYADWALHPKKDRNFFKDMRVLAHGAYSSIAARESFRHLDDLFLDLVSLKKI